MESDLQVHSSLASACALPSFACLTSIEMCSLSLSLDFGSSDMPGRATLRLHHTHPSPPGHRKAILRTGPRYAVYESSSCMYTSLTRAEKVAGQTATPATVHRVAELHKAGCPNRLKVFPLPPSMLSSVVSLLFTGAGANLRPVMCSKGPP